jgi:hypothetical protein
MAERPRLRAGTGVPCPHTAWGVPEVSPGDSIALDEHKIPQFLAAGLGEQPSQLSKCSEKFDLTYSHIGMYYPLYGQSGYNL